MFSGDGNGNFGSFRFNVLRSILIGEFSTPRPRKNIMVRNPGSSGEKKYSVDHRKGISETHGARRDRDNTCVSTRIGRAWDGPALLDDTIRELESI